MKCWCSIRLRSSGIENSPIHFADLAMVMGFMAMAGIFRESGIKKIPYLFGPVLGLVATLLADTRSAVLVGAALGIVFIVMFWRSWSASLATKMGALALAIGIAVAMLVVGSLLGFGRFFTVFEIVKQIVSGAALTDASTAYRLEMYRGGLLAFRDAPMFGHGWHNQVASAIAYMDEQAKQGFLIEDWAYLHNEPLGFAVSAGVLGIASYCLLMLSSLVGIGAIPKEQRLEGQLYLGLVLVVGLFVSGMTDVLFMSELPKTFFVFMSAAIVVLCGGTGSNPSSQVTGS